MVAVVAALVAPAVGWAQDGDPETLDDNPISTPDLGVDAQGGAVVAWVGFAETTNDAGRPTVVDALHVSVREPDGAFSPPQPVSSLDTDVTRDMDLGVGRSGEAAVVWREQEERTTATPIMVSRRPAHGVFGRGVAVRGSAGGRDPSVAVGGEGSVLVAWLEGSGRRGCGNVVWAARARPGGSFGRARRVSGRCPNASAPRAALGPDGRGAVAWRARPSGGETELQAAPFRRGRFDRAREVSRAPISAVGFAIAGDRTGATLAWRDAGGNAGEGDAGRVLVARVASGLRTRPKVVADGGRFVGPPRLAAHASGAALLTFERARPNRPLHRPSVYASRRATLGAAFREPQLVAECGATDEAKTFAFPALDATGVATIVFQTACGGPLGIGPNPGLAITQARPGGSWSPPAPLSSGGFAVGVEVAMADAGGAIAAWTERAFGAPEAVEGLRVAVLR